MNLEQGEDLVHCK